MAILEQYNIEHPKSPIDFELTMKKCLMHDLEESKTGDIPSPVKEEDPLLRSLLRKTCIKILKRDILKDSPNPKSFLKIWKEDKSGETGEVVRVADKLEGLLAAYFEVKNGNWYLQPALFKHLEWFEEKQGQKLLKKFTYANKEYLEVVEYLLNQNELKDDKQTEVNEILDRYVLK
jgi:5'-deoxynucleotidase YfbR-like HD superfamily hydrolase